MIDLTNSMKRGPGRGPAVFALGGVSRLWFAVLLLAILAPVAQAQTGDPVYPIRLGLVDDDPSGMLGYGIEYSKIFNKEFTEPDAPWDDFLKSQSFSFDPVVKLGNARVSTPGLLDLNLDPHFDVPLIESGFRPDDADLKLGMIYLEFGALRYEFLASDNVDYTVDDRKSGAISIATVDLTITGQWTEGLQTTVDGTFIWLPFENKAGVSGFGLNDPYEASLSYGYNSQFRLETEYAAVLAGWDVSLRQYFLAGSRDYQADAGYRSSIKAWSDAEFDGEDIAGRYSFGNRSGGNNSDSDHNGIPDGFEDSRTKDDDWELTTELDASRVIPLDQSIYARLEGNFRNTLSNDDDYLLSETDETYTVQLTSERENTRFVPFVIYTLSRSYDNRNPDDEIDDLHHALRVGVTGPVTENISIYGDFGYTLDEYHDEEVADSESEVYTFGITHVVNPYISHSATISRSINDDHDITDTFNYSYRQTLGPRLELTASYEQGKAFHRRSGRSDLEMTSWYQRTGADLTYTYSTRTTITLSGTHTNTREFRQNSDIGEIEEWRLELRVDYQYSDTLRFSFTAFRTEEEFIESDDHGSRIVEDVVMLSLTKDL